MLTYRSGNIFLIARSRFIQAYRLITARITHYLELIRMVMPPFAMIAGRPWHPMDTVLNPAELRREI